MVRRLDSSERATTDILQQQIPKPRPRRNVASIISILFGLLNAYFAAVAGYCGGDWINLTGITIESCNWPNI